MSRLLAVLVLGLVCADAALAQGLLIPAAKDVTPFALARHEVNVAIEDQVAVTHVVQTFRNHTARDLEATYVFPVPKGASVKKFTMWVNGKEVHGELVEANKAREIYTDIVRRTQDPGLLEYMDNNLLRVRVFPVPANGEQKLAVSYTSLAVSDAGLIEYAYPLKADGKTGQNLEKFTFEAKLKAQHPIQNVYSPTHTINISRPNDREAVVRFEGKQETADKDFQLYYTAAAKDVGLTALVHRPRGSDGHFMLLISPRAELSQAQTAPRDLVFVLDSSGSMAGKRIVQARNALKHCLNNLKPEDRFGLIHFATATTKYKNDLISGTDDNQEAARAWVEELQAAGSTNINEALAEALAMRSNDRSRTFTVIFFTDGLPTIGETRPEQILKNVVDKNTAETRIFTFGVGDDVNTVLLDQVADKTRSVSTYVRETEDIEAKVSNLYGKISHPVLTNLKIAVDSSKSNAPEFVGFRQVRYVPPAPVQWSEIYPPQLPDLFHGSQLVVLGRYDGKGPAKVTLTGMVGEERKEFTYDVSFPAETTKDKAFVEDLWARRKVGYLLDQIRTNGENKELKDEVVALAKKHGITTPYTSYLVVPDGTAPVANNGVPIDWVQYYKSHGYQVTPNAAGNRVMFAPVFVSPQMGFATPNSGLTGAPPSGATNGIWNASPSSEPIPAPVLERLQAHPPAKATTRGGWLNSSFGSAPVPTTAAPPVPTWGGYPGSGNSSPIATSTAPVYPSPAQSGKTAVDYAQALAALRTQEQVAASATREAAGRKCVELNGVWIDDGFDPKLPQVKVKAQSAAYFRILERHPHMRQVFQLGNQVMWVTPNGSVLVIHPSEGVEQLSDAEVDALFAVK